MATLRTARKLLLGREIAHMIDAAGVSQHEAAKMIETSQPRIHGLISGQWNISPGDLVMLATKLGFTDEGHHAALLELRRDNHKRGFWSIGHNRAYSEEIRLRIDLEKIADRIQVVEVEVVPGIAQCESYVRAMYQDLPEIDGVTVEEQVKARSARQDIYNADNPPNVQFVLSESCLRRYWADAEVMREQVDYLIKLSNRPNVMLRIVPFKAPLGRRSPIGNRFTLLRVPSPGIAGPLEMAYAEGEGEIRYLDDKRALAAHTDAWDRLTNAALSFDDSRKFMRQIAADFRD
jgi:predicted XRE-type DNA-binding protein